jgi:hypothetical protein
MENEQRDPGISLFQLNLDAANSYTLRSAASWARVLGVVGALAGLIMAALFIYMLGRDEPATGYITRGEGFNDALSGNDRESAKIAYWFFVIAGIIFLVGGIFSYMFGNKMHAALRSNDQDGLDKAFGWLRNYFAFRSIIIIILFLLFLLGMASVV